VEASVTQEPTLVWGDPAKPGSKLDTRPVKAQVLKAQMLKEQGEDSAKALDALLARRMEPDAAQALFQAMAELATGKPAGVSEGVLPALGLEMEARTKLKPEEIKLYAPPIGKTGIAMVAGIAKALAPRMGQQDMSPFDQVLFEHAIRLMGFHGAPSPDSAAQAAQGQAVRTQAPPPMDPDVRATLRNLLGSRATQVYAVRALGQLGDMETAKEIIDNPGRYPDASIADFGPNAVERYKNARKLAIAQGRGAGEAAFFQSMRIPPEHQDAAIELAMAGDGGAILAAQRNWVVMDGMEKDPDAMRAVQMDAALRFPGTRAAWVGQRRGIDSFFMAPDNGPKSYAMILKVLEHDLTIFFSGQPWTWEQMNVLSNHSGILSGLWHAARYGGLLPGERKLEKEVEALFRRLYRPYTNIALRGTHAAHESGIAWSLAIYAGHLKLKPLEFEEKGDRKALAIEIRDKDKNNNFGDIKSQIRRRSGDRYSAWALELHLCEAERHIRHVEDL
jgi:hypothetical protein